MCMTVQQLYNILDQPILYVLNSPTMRNMNAIKIYSFRTKYIKINFCLNLLEDILLSSH